eukprot:2386310-Lingulodinium_polyedra.AAC.1
MLGHNLGLLRNRLGTAGVGAPGHARTPWTPWAKGARTPRGPSGRTGRPGGAFSNKLNTP